MADLPDFVAGFTVLPVTYSPSSTHILYARSHTGSKKSKITALPEGRTLFLVNIPPDATERELILFFKHCGTVEKIIFDQDGGIQEQVLESDDEYEDDAIEETGLDDTEEQPRKKRRVAKDKLPLPPKVIPLPTRALRTIRRTGRSAHVVFLDSSSVDRAVAHPHIPRPWPKSIEEPSGLLHYATLYDSLRPPLDAVREHADSYMELFEYDQAKRKQNSTYRKGEAVVDEDGFTLVTRGGAYGQTLGGGVRVASKKFQDGKQRKRGEKKKSAEKDGFYAFQKAQKQMKSLMDLQKKWQEDKAAVEKLKASRHFRPY